MTWPTNMEINSMLFHFVTSWEKINLSCEYSTPEDSKRNQPILKLCFFIARSKVSTYRQNFSFDIPSSTQVLHLKFNQYYRQSFSLSTVREITMLRGEKRTVIKVSYPVHPRGPEKLTSDTPSRNMRRKRKNAAI